MPNCSLRARPMAGDREPPMVRQIRAQDAAALAKILEDAPETVAWGPEEACNRTLSANAIFLVGESEGEVLGFLLARHVADESEILNIAVRRADRRLGVATALLREAVDQARSHGVTRVYLE